MERKFFGGSEKIVLLACIAYLRKAVTPATGRGLIQLKASHNTILFCSEGAQYQQQPKNKKNFSHEFELSLFCLMTRRIRGFEFDSHRVKKKEDAEQHKCKWINTKRTSSNAFGMEQMLIRS